MPIITASDTGGVLSSPGLSSESWTHTLGPQVTKNERGTQREGRTIANPDSALQQQEPALKLQCVYATNGSPSLPSPKSTRISLWPKLTKNIQRRGLWDI